MNPNTLILMVGLPRSGKSSEARQMGYPIVCRDSIRYALGGTIRYFKEEKRVSEIEEIMVASLFHAGHQDVIVDACHLRPKYRNRWRSLAEKNDWNVYIFHVMTSLETCLSRAARTFPDEPNFQRIIYDMWSKSDISVGPIPEKQSDHWS